MKYEVDSLGRKHTFFLVNPCRSSSLHMVSEHTSTWSSSWSAVCNSSMYRSGVCSTSLSRNFKELVVAIESKGNNYVHCMDTKYPMSTSVLNQNMLGLVGSCQHPSQCSCGYICSIINRTGSHLPGHSEQEILCFSTQVFPHLSVGCAVVQQNK